MPTMRTRIDRSRESEALVAEYLRPLYPSAERVAASLPGRDILGTPGVALEVKAVQNLVKAPGLKAALRQAHRNAAGDLAAVVARMTGDGPANVGDWPVVLRFADFVELLRRAEFGAGAPE